MDKYKVAIVDDDEVALENLSFELGKDARFFLKGTARNGKQGKKLIAKVQPDLLFLDVEMPDMPDMSALAGNINLDESSMPDLSKLIKLDDLDLDLSHMIDPEEILK